MTKSLAKVAFVGITVSVMSFVAAGAMIAGAAAGNIPLDIWGEWDTNAPRCPDGFADTPGARASRILAWGGNDIHLEIPATLRFRRGTAKSAVIRGPENFISHIAIENGHVAFDCRFRADLQGIEIEMTGSGVTEFSLQGAGDMILEDLAGGRAQISIAGSGSVRATGNVDRLELSIAGSGDADLGGLSVRESKISIAGSGDAIVAPEERLEVSIAGSGDVRLMTDPEDVTSSIFGSGRIIGPARTN